MITLKEAIKKVERTNPQRRVETVCEYKGDYLVSAPGKKFKTIDYSDPYFLVDKETGKIYPFSPMEDLQGFHEAMVNNNLYRAE